MRSARRIGRFFASIVATCKLSDVNPVAYIAETLQAIIDGHPKSKIEDLMPRNLGKRRVSPRRGSGERLHPAERSRTAHWVSEASVSVYQANPMMVEAVSGIRATTLISKSKPASQFTPTAVQLG